MGAYSEADRVLPDLLDLLVEWVCDWVRCKWRFVRISLIVSENLMGLIWVE